MPRGGELTIQAALDAGHVSLSLIDTGKGMTPEVMARVFKPFFSTKPRGMGMGLAISRSIIESHGGRISAAPNSPRGMAFSFGLPASSATADLGSAR